MCVCVHVCAGEVIFDRTQPGFPPDIIFSEGDDQMEFEPNIDQLEVLTTTQRIQCDPLMLTTTQRILCGPLMLNTTQRIQCGPLMLTTTQCDSP